MQANKSANENKKQPKSCELDNRYGEIGISAFSAAMRFRGEERKYVRTRHTPQDSY